MSNTYEIDKNLKSAIKEKRLVIFAGSGISKGLGVPSWDEFVKQVLEGLTRCNDIDKDDKKLYKNILNGTNLKGKINDIKPGPAREYALRYISDAFTIPANRSCYIQERLLDISGRIITTNFDNAFERAYETGHAGDLPLVVLGTSENNDFNLSQLDKPRKDSNRKDSNRKDSNDFIYKIHGSVSNPENCILFEDNYKDFYKNSKYGRAKSILEQFCRDDTILFIGWSFDDQYVKELFKCQCNGNDSYRKHYIITAEPDKFPQDQYSFLKVIQVCDYSNESMNKLYDELESHVHKTPLENLREKDIFKNMARSSLEVIASVSPKKLRKNEQLSSPNEGSNIFWVILEGTITANEQSDSVEPIEKNDVIGELGFVLNSHRTRNTVCTSEKAKVIPITHNVLNRISKEDQEKLWKNIVGTYLKRIAKQKLSKETKKMTSWEEIAKVFSNSFRENNYDIDNIELYLLRYINESPI